MHMNFTEYSVLTNDLRRNPSILQSTQQQANRLDPHARMKLTERGDVTTVTTITAVTA